LLIATAEVRHGDSTGNRQVLLRQCNDAWCVNPPLTNALGILADILWMLAYIFAIWVGFRDHTYGFPLVAVCLNVSWEFLFSLVFRPTSKVRMILTLLWLALDLVILYQLLRWGAADQLPLIQAHFIPIVLGTLLLAAIGHFTFHCTYDDPGGEQAAFAINLVMSILFVFLLLRRSDLRGLSYAAAWLKMLGTLILSAVNTALMYKEPRRYGFYLFLFAAIFLFDVLYICLFAQARAQ
jgi:hypothetical protein